MAKPNLDALQADGERQLTEWGLGDDSPAADLGAVLLRDSAADVAIAHRLGAIASDESAELLRRLEHETTDKRVRKEAKRALYRLEQRGVHVPTAPPEPGPAPAIAAPIEGYVSPFDGRGDQLVWLVKPQPAGVAHLFAVLNDPEGMREAALTPVTRKALRTLREELERKHDLRLVEADWHYVDFLMHRAFDWARARGTRMTGDYPALRAQLTRQPAPAPQPPLVLRRVEAPAVDADPALLAHAPDLLEEREFRTWFLAEEQLRFALDELAGVRDSPLVLNPMQQQDRYEDVLGRAIDTLFGGEAQPSWARRLYEMGYFFAVTRRPQRAAQAVAVARALEGGSAPRQVPFCAQLVRTSLAFFVQRAAEQEQEREKTSLVLTPQQALAQRDRR